jgi:hypothetical protein
MSMFATKGFTLSKLFFVPAVEITNCVHNGTCHPNFVRSVSVSVSLHTFRCGSVCAAYLHIQKVMEKIWKQKSEKKLAKVVRLVQHIE